MVWRCGRAFSPGSRIWSAVVRLVVVPPAPPIASGSVSVQHAPLDRGRGRDLHGVVDQRPQHLPFPEMRRRAALARLVGERALPQRPEVARPARPCGSPRRSGCRRGRRSACRLRSWCVLQGRFRRHYSKCARVLRAASRPGRSRHGAVSSAARRRGRGRRCARHRRGHVVAAPGDMAVRPHQHQRRLVERGDVGIGEGDLAHRHAARLGGLDQARARRAGWRRAAAAQSRRRTGRASSARRRARHAARACPAGSRARTARVRAGAAACRPARRSASPRSSIAA